MYEDNKYLIFSVDELTLVNFDEVLETSIGTVRKSVDGTKTAVNWVGDTPSFVDNITTKEGIYTYNEILEILNTEYWTLPMEILPQGE
jgi:hypothetical protein